MSHQQPSSSSLTSSERAEWEKSSIDELRAAEFNRRRLAEEKAEELRQLVGIRYRVLIDTADNIQNMSTIANNSIETIEKLQNTVQNLLNPAENIQPIHSPNECSSQLLLQINSFIRSPERIWSSLSSKKYLHALQFYIEAELLYREIEEKIEIQKWKEMVKNTSNNHIIHTMEQRHLHLFIAQHYACLKQFPAIIVENANRELLERNLTVEQYSELLIAILLITGDSIQTILKLFLNSRTNWIKTLLNAANKALTTFPNSNPSYVISHCLTTITFILQTTIIHLAQLFGPVKHNTSNNTNNSEQTTTHFATKLQQFYSSNQSNDNTNNAEESLKHYNLSSTELNSSTRNWLDELMVELHSQTSEISLSTLLNRLETGKQLAEVRDKILSQLAFQSNDITIVDNKNSTEENKLAECKQRKELWEECCLTVFQSNTNSSAVTVIGLGNSTMKSRQSSLLSLWDLIFSSAFHSRFKAVVEQSFHRLQLQQTIEKSLKQWKNNTNNTANNNNNLPSPTTTTAGPSTQSTLDHSLENSIPLELLGFRDSEVCGIVNSFLHELSSLANDVSYLLQCNYLKTEQELIQKQKQKQLNINNTENNNNSSSIITAIHSVYVDFSSLRYFIQSELTPHIHRMYSSLVAALVNDLRKKLSELEGGVLNSMSSAQTWKSNQCIELVEQAVFIGRICYSITQQPSLMSFTQLLDNSSNNNNNSSTSSILSAAISPTNSSSAVQTSLSTTARSAFRIWTRYISAILNEQFETNLNHWFQSNSIQQNTFTNKIQSQTFPIFIPTHQSSYITSLLFNLQHHLYSIHGYSIQSDMLIWLLTDLNNSLLTALTNKINKNNIKFHSKLSAQCKLQLFFDIQYLFALLRLPPLNSSNDDRKRYSNLIQTIDNQLNIELDAINWTVTKPNLDYTINQAIQRTSLIFGLLIKLNPLPPLFESKLPTTTNTVTTTTPTKSSSTANETPQLPINLISLAPVGARILPLSTTSLYPSKNPAANSTSSSSSSLYNYSSPSRLQNSASASAIMHKSAATANNNNSSLSHSTSASAALSDLKATGRQLLGKLNLY